MQIDDVFAITELYKPRNDDELMFRINGEDCHSHLEQQDRINAMLPAGSNYKYVKVHALVVSRNPDLGPCNLHLELANVTEMRCMM